MNSRRLWLIPLLAMTLFTPVLVGTALAADLGEPVEYDLTFPTGRTTPLLRHVLGQ